MAACSNIDLNKEQVTEMLTALETMVDRKYRPETIVEYVSAGLGLPVEGEVNYCLVPCVSSALYKHVVVTGDQIEYKTKARTVAEIKKCFPVFKESSCSGGGVNKDSRGCAGKSKSCQGKQASNMDKLIAAVMAYFMRIIGKYVAELIEKIKNYMTTIALQEEHKQELTWANIVKKIGAAVDWIAKTYKTIKDQINSFINATEVKLEKETDEGGSTKKHLKKALKEAQTLVEGYITDIIKNAGQYVEQIGDFLKDVSDISWDSKEEIFKIISLAMEARRLISEILLAYQRLSFQIRNMSIVRELQAVLYKNIYEYTSQMDLSLSIAAGNSDLAINGKIELHPDAFIFGGPAVTGGLGVGGTGPLSDPGVASALAPVLGDIVAPALGKANAAVNNAIGSQISNAVNKVNSAFDSAAAASHALGAKMPFLGMPGDQPVIPVSANIGPVSVSALIAPLAPNPVPAFGALISKGKNVMNGKVFPMSLGTARA